MSHRRMLTIPVILILACGLVLYGAYQEVKQQTIIQFNRLQLTLAREAGRNIEHFFQHYFALLNELAQQPEIVHLDERGREMLKHVYRQHAHEITAITRVDAAGRIVVSYPQETLVEGADLSDQEHVREVIRTHRPWVSDVFRANQGGDCIAFHVPVLEEGRFEGSLAVLFPFAQIAKDNLEGIRIGDEGYAWMISQKGVEIYCPVPGHVGKSVFENCRDFPSILEMAQEMVQGKQGETTYTFDRIRGETVEAVTKHAVYMPIHLFNTFWSIVVATPEKEVLSAISGFRNRWFLAVGLVLIAGAIWLYQFLRGILFLEEAKRRIAAEEALRGSELKYRTLFEQATDAIFLLKNDRFVDCNTSALKMFGCSREEIVGKYPYEFSPPVQPGGESSQELALARIGQALKGELVSFEWKHCRGDGTCFDAEVSLSCIQPSGEKLVLGMVRDITKRKNAEREILAATRRWQDIIEFLPDATFVLDENRKVIAWNRAIEIMTGVAKQDMLGKTDYAYAVPFYGRPRPIMIDMVLDPESGDEKNYQVFQRQGDTLLAEVYAPFAFQGKGAFLWGKASPLYDAEGKVVGAIQSIRDITAYKLTEEHLKQTRDYLENVLENSPDAIGIVDEKGRFVKWNRMAREVFGFTFSEVQGKRAFDFYADRDELERMLSRLRSDGAVRNWEISLKKKDGGVVPAEFSLSLLKGEDGKNLGSVCVARDLSGIKLLLHQVQETNEKLLREIADRERAEKALRESENTYRTIFENTGSATVIIEEDTTISLANAQFEKLSGHTRQEIEGRMSWTEFVEQGDLERMKGYHEQRRISPGSAPNQYEFRFVDRMGNIRTVVATVAVIPGTRKSVASLIDITEQKRIEEELWKVQKLESVGILAGGIAHDFNNLLGVILGNISLAQQYLKPSEPPMKLLETAESACLASKNLTQRLITFSGGGTLIKKPENIDDILTSAIDLAMAGSGIGWRIHHPPGLWPVKCDSGQIRQVLINLLINAREAMERGGTIAVEASNVSVKAGEIGSLREGRYVSISIQDTGAGILPGILPRIFDPYFSTKQRGSQKGMGLGLAVAYTAVKNHDGDILVESRVGKGTTFRVYLPACEEEPAHVVEPDSPVERTRGKVLVMDDEELFRNMVGDMLKMLGYEAELAAHGREAIEMFRSAREAGTGFDVVILDLTVRGGLGGMATVKELLALDPSVTAVVSTGYADDDVVCRHRDFGFSGVLVKPYRTKDLEALLAGLIRKKTES